MIRDMFKLCVSWAIVASIAASSLSAQRRDTASPLKVFVRDAHQRWMYGRQQAAFTPMTASSRAVRIVGIERDAAKKTQTLSLTFSSNSAQPGKARLTTDARGHVIRIAASFAAPRPRRELGPPLVDAADELRWEIFDGVGERFASLPETRVWDLVPVRGGTPLKIGSRWHDTLNLHASLEKYRQSLRGVRESTIIGDTLVRGVRLWIVRDSALVHYEERLVEEERTLDTAALIDRSVDGTIVGRHLLDPVLGLYLWRVDTTTLSGIAVLRYADGRSFRTPARFEQTQRVELVDDASFRERERQRIAEYGEFSIVMRPEGDAERIASGDTNYVNALLDTVVLTRDPAMRARAIGLLRFASVQPPSRLRTSILRAGDTASVIRGLENEWINRRHPIDESDFALLLPMMADPGVAFAFGLERDPHYENARQGLLTRPPATTPDTAEWPCVPTVCRALAAQWTAGGDARLRSLALIAQLSLDPRRWADTVLARFTAGDRFLAPAVELIRGVAAAWPAGSHAPIPAAGADWRAWSNWMDGHNQADAYVGSDQLARFDDSHVQAIKFAQALTGRDFAAEWREGVRVATSDTARFVYGSMLVGFGETPDDANAIAARLQSTSPLMRAFAVSEIATLFAGAASVADAATTEEVQDRVLAVAIDDAPPWPVLDSAMWTTRREPPMPRKIVSAADMAYDRPAPTPGPLVLRGGDLAPAVRARWERRNVRIVDSPWEPKSSESVIIVAISDVRRVGPFARVSIDQSHLTARVNGRGQSWESGTTLYLMQRGGKWFIVSADSWIT